MDRRRFLQTGLSGMAASAIGNFGAEAADLPAKRVGLIGCGWYGKSDIFRLVQVAPVEIVSFCDVDKNNLEEAAKWAVERQASKKKPQLFTDYREMLKQDGLDMVEIATPGSLACAADDRSRQGGDRHVRAEADQRGRGGRRRRCWRRRASTSGWCRWGLQRRSTPHLIEARTLVKEGKLGHIGHVEIYSYGGGRATAAEPAPVPDTLDWEFWMGPAPMMPYSPDVQRNWRAFMEYGNGTIGDMGIHMFDMVRWFMGLGWPKRISSFGGLRVLKGGKSNIADTQTAMFEYDNVDIVWQHRRFGPSVDPNYPWGATLYGEQGTLKAGRDGLRFHSRRAGRAADT